MTCSGQTLSYFDVSHIKLTAIAHGVNTMIIFIRKTALKIAVCILFDFIFQKFPCSIGTAFWVNHNFFQILEPFYSIFYAIRTFFCPKYPQIITIHFRYAFGLRAVTNNNIILLIFLLEDTETNSADTSETGESESEYHSLPSYHNHFPFTGSW